MQLTGAESTCFDFVKSRKNRLSKATALVNAMEASVILASGEPRKGDRASCNQVG